MTTAPRRLLASLLIIGGCSGGMVGWIGVVLAGRQIGIFVQDWIVYYAAGRAALAGKLALLFDGAGFTGYQYGLLAGWFAAPPVLHPFLYPPPFLLLLAPLALLPFAVSYAAFVGLSGAAAVAALAWRGDGRGMAWPRGLMLLFFPATCIDALTGQNALLSTALMVGGVGLIERRPLLGGASLGLLSYKPQLFLLVPVALVAARAWRALAACVLAALALALGSAALFGLETWRSWIDASLLAPDPALVAWLRETFVTGFSVYVSALLLGLGERIALAAQLAAALVSLVAVAWAWRRPGAHDARLAVLLVAAIVATPHLQAYDLVLLGAAVVLLFAEATIGLGAGALFAVIWALPLLRPYLVPGGRVVVPIALLALLAYAVARPARAASSPLASAGLDPA